MKIQAFSLAALSAVSLFLSGCGTNADAPPEFDKAAEQLTQSCKYYSNVLNLADVDHFNGKTDTSHNEMAGGALQQIMTSAINDDNFTLNEDETALTSVTLNNGETITFAPPQTNLETYEDHCGYLQDTIQKVSQTTNSSIQELFEAGINGALHVSRDPHTSYLSSKDYTEMMDSISGEFAGVGIQINVINDEVNIVAPFEDGPAARAGIIAGDKITHIDGQDIASIGMDGVVDAIKGQIGTDVTLTIKRGDSDPFDLSITRDTIVMRAVEGELVGPKQDIGYVAITTFSERTSGDLVVAISDLVKESNANNRTLSELVIDLRGNPGGLLDQAKMVADLFVRAPKGRLTPLMAEGRSHNDNITYVDSINRKNLIGVDLKVLIDQGSASASEIVSGILKDAGIEVIGVPSYGKGSIQTLIPLTEDGSRAFRRRDVRSALRLTTGVFFPGASGLSNQQSGVIPSTRVTYNDDRDDAAAEAHREKDNERALISSELTRAGNTPVKSCTLKTEFSGTLSETQWQSIPLYLRQQGFQLDEQTERYEPVVYLDAALDCAINSLEGGSDYTVITPYRAP